MGHLCCAPPALGAHSTKALARRTRQTKVELVVAVVRSARQLSCAAPIESRACGDRNDDADDNDRNASRRRRRMHDLHYDSLVPERSRARSRSSVALVHFRPAARQTERTRTHLSLVNHPQDSRGGRKTRTRCGAGESLVGCVRRGRSNGKMLRPRPIKSRASDPSS